MWKRGGRSSALERAEALLSTKRRHTTPTHTGGVPPKALTSDLNEPSGSSNSEEGVGVMGSTDVEQSGDGAGRRFMKKGTTSATGIQNPVQHRPEPRYPTSSHRGSQSPASSPLAQMENRITTAKPSRYEVGVSTGTRSAEAALVLSAQFSRDQTLTRTRFLKNGAAGSARTTGPTRGHSGAMSPSHEDGGTKSAKVVGGVSLDSDEEDMRRLLEDSVDSTHHPRRPGTAAPQRANQKTSNRQSHKVIWSSVTSVHRPLPPDPSPPQHSSPFEWTGPARTPLSPSILSQSPHRPFESPSLPESLVSTDKKDSIPQHSMSSTCSQQGPLSLEELFAADHDSNSSHSEMSSASSDFKINVMGLDDLVPEFTEEIKEKKLWGSPDVGPSDGPKDEEVLDYHSDFDPETRTESSTSPISEHIQTEGEKEETGSEVRGNAAGSSLSYQKTEDDYTSPVSDSSPDCSLRTSDRSQNTTASSAIRQRGPTEPHGGCTCGRSLRDPGLEHIPQYVHAFTTYNPSMLVLIEMLKQQLDVTRHFVERSRHLHTCLVQSLEPPNYKYTSLEDTKMSINKHRPPTTTTKDV